MGVPAIFIVAVGAAVIVLVAIQLNVLLMQSDALARQTALIDRMTELATRQSQIIDASIAKHSEPRTEFIIRAYDAATRMIELAVTVRNGGTKAITGLYAHLFVDATIGPVAVDRQSTYEVASTDVGSYHHFSTYVAEPIFPTRGVLIWTATIGGVASDREYSIGVKIVTEEGAFPPDADAIGLLLSTTGVRVQQRKA